MNTMVFFVKAQKLVIVYVSSYVPRERVTRITSSNSNPNV